MKQKTWTVVLVVAFLIVAVMQFRIMDETKKMGALLIDLGAILSDAARVLGRSGAGDPPNALRETMRRFICVKKP